MRHFAAAAAAFGFIVSAAQCPAAQPASQGRFDAMVDRVRAEMLTDPRSAAAHAQAGEQLASSIGDPVKRRLAQGTAAWLQAEALYRLGDNAGAKPLIGRAVTLVHDAGRGTKTEGDVLVTSGSIHGSSSEVAAALTDYQHAHAIFLHVGYKRGQALSLVCLAMLYLDANVDTAALRYLQEALEAYPPDAGLAFAIYNSRGLIYQRRGDFARAGAEFREALRFAHQWGSAQLETLYLRNIARNHLLAGQLGSAERTIDAALAVKGAGRDSARQLDAIGAQAALQRDRPMQAEVLIGRAFAGVDLARTDVAMRDAHQTAVAVYRARGRSDLALAHLQALKRLDDQSTKLATEANTALLAARFDSANQETKIARLRDGERLRQAREALQRAQTERTLWLGGAGATATIILLLLFVIAATRRSRDQVRDANDGLAVTNAALGKALAAKTEFLATTSHEIRTPLNGILGMTQVMLADRGLAAATRDRLTVVQSAGLTMRALVDDILDVAKMETGHLALEQAPFDLRSVLEATSQLWAEHARAKGLSFTTDLARCPLRVEGDAARVRQIAANLLSNAVKFTAAGSVVLSAESLDEGVRLTVTDTGIGIADDKQDAVFESFRQADTSTTRQFGGTGLGLSICRSLAHAMGGEVTLTSRLGEGASFAVDLPLRTVPAVAPACAAPAGGETVLVIDRNPIARAMFRTLFAPRIAVVAFATSGEDAATCFASGTVAHVLIDEATAQASGDAIGFVRDVVARAGTARVSLLWSAADEAERAELLALGAARIITKPVSGAALVRALFDDRSMRADTLLVSQAA